MATPKLKEQLRLAKEMGFPEIVIPVNEAEEAEEAIRTVQGEAGIRRGTEIPPE